MNTVTQKTHSVRLFWVYLFVVFGIFFSITPLVRAQSASTFLLNGASTDVYLATATSNFTIQVTGTNNPTLCYMNKYIGGVWGGWIAIPCSMYASATNVTPSTFGFPTGMSYLNFYTSNAGGGTNSAVLGVFVPAPILPGTINVTSNVANSWTITGPQTITGSGVSQTSTGIQPGPYTITWGSFAGTGPVITQALSLASGGTITFTGSFFPDLIPEMVINNSTDVNTPVILSSVIRNDGNLPSGGFPRFFQVSSTAGGGGTITDFSASVASPLVIWGSTVATASHIFTAAGTYSVRVCVDGTSASKAGLITAGGVINESNENNNCSPWADIVVGLPNQSGTVWTWGFGPYALGLGSAVNIKYIPTQIDSNIYTAIASGNYVYATFAIRQDGTLWGWGAGGGAGLYNNFNTLGTGYSLNGPYETYTPTQIGTNTYKAISAGYSHSLAIKTDGTLWTWGWNTNGQLGTGDIVARYTPVQVGGATYTVISAGDSVSFAIRSDGTLWAWGYNGQGGLGLGDIIRRDVPTQVGSDTYVAIATGGGVGGGSTLAIKSDGTLWGWGGNYYGELGLGGGDVTGSAPRTDNVPMNVKTPTQVGTATYIAISSGSQTSLAIKSDGTLWSAGYNVHGQLGLGPVGNKSLFTQVGTETTWTAVTSSAFYHSLAIKSDGTLWAWGSNSKGQLGLGNDQYIPSKYTPTQVGTSLYSAIDAGYMSSIAIARIVAPSTLKVCPNPCNFSVPPFNGVTFSSIPTTLYACYGLATDCNGGDTNVIGTWSATNTPNDAINLSTNSGSSVNVSGNYSGSGTVMENITLSYLTATPVTAIASVSCTPLACNDPSITSQRTSYCPTETRTFDNSCTGTLDCPGTRNCDYNWREVAP